MSGLHGGWWKTLNLTLLLVLTKQLTDGKYYHGAKHILKEVYSVLVKALAATCYTVCHWIEH
jgi:hypothetical protein